MFDKEEEEEFHIYLHLQVIVVGSTESCLLRFSLVHDIDSPDVSCGTQNTNRMYKYVTLEQEY